MLRAQCPICPKTNLSSIFCHYFELINQLLWDFSFRNIWVIITWNIFLEIHTLWYISKVTNVALLLFFCRSLISSKNLSKRKSLHDLTHKMQVLNLLKCPLTETYPKTWFHSCYIIISWQSALTNSQCQSKSGIRPWIKNSRDPNPHNSKC